MAYNVKRKKYIIFLTNNNLQRGKCCDNVRYKSKGTNWTVIQRTAGEGLAADDKAPLHNIILYN